MYLLITDLHWTHKNFRSRISYSNETQHSLNFILDTIIKYENRGYIVRLIFLGDIFHSSYDSVFEGITANNLMIRIKSMVDSMDGVMGNHEYTYYTDNPFWTLMQRIESDRLKYFIGDKRPVKGTLDILNIPDEVICGNVRFIFNHFGCSVATPPKDGKINIGLFHKDIYNKDIVADAKTTNGFEVFEHTPFYFDSSPVFDGYDYAFMAHAHMFYSEWDYYCELSGQNTKIAYLSTLGRTNQLEVRDNFLERDIPAIIIEDDKFIRREYNKFDLLKRSDCVIERQVEINQKKYKEQVERRQARDLAFLSDDPIENLRLNLRENALLSHMFEGTLLQGRSQLEEKVLKEIREVY